MTHNQGTAEPILRATALVLLVLPVVLFSSLTNAADEQLSPLNSGLPFAQLLETDTDGPDTDDQVISSHALAPSRSDSSSTTSAGAVVFVPGYNFNATPARAPPLRSSQTRHFLT